MKAFQSFELKIIDFGFARHLGDLSSSTSSPVLTTEGTPEFVSPEVINYQPITTTTDMWYVLHKARLYYHIICNILIIP